MNYTITLGKGNGTQTLVELYPGCPVDVPAFVSIGVNSRMIRYKDWLDSSISNVTNDPTKTKRLRFLAFIHKVGTENGSITIQSKHALREMQIKCVKDFLIEHNEFLNTALPYIFNDVVNVSDNKGISNTISPTELNKHFDPS